MYALEKDDYIREEDMEALKKLKKDLKKSDLLPTDLLQYKILFKRYADFQFMSIDGLRRISYFMGLEPVTGFNIINNVLGLITLKKFQIPIDAPGVNYISKFFLNREIKMYFNRIRKDDEALSFDRLDNFTEE